jgi:hypothetical protein
MDRDKIRVRVLGLCQGERAGRYCLGLGLGSRLEKEKTKFASHLLSHKGCTLQRLTQRQCIKQLTLTLYFKALYKDTLVVGVVLMLL